MKGWKRHVLSKLRIRNEEVRMIMGEIPRGLFCPHPDFYARYRDSPCPLTYAGIVDGGGATLSAPSIHALALDLIADRWKSIGYRPYSLTHVLDVGSGSGYMCVALAGLMKELSEHPHTNYGRVLGIEYYASLVEWSQKQVAQVVRPADIQKHVTIQQGDGWKGFPKYEYMAIHVGAAADTVPQALVEQLARGGRMVIPVGREHQELLVIDKDDEGRVTQRKQLDVRFVPLVHI